MRHARPEVGHTQVRLLAVAQVTLGQAAAAAAVTQWQGLSVSRTVVRGVVTDAWGVGDAHNTHTREAAEPE